MLTVIIISHLQHYSTLSTSVSSVGADGIGKV